jgi:hypothetical protein
MTNARHLQFDSGAVFQPWRHSYRVNSRHEATNGSPDGTLIAYATFGIGNA